MKYKHGLRRRAVEYEKAIVAFWKKDGTFEASVEQRPVDDSYVFYDGPPFITGAPHHGTLLSSIVKDCVPRYWTMKGKRVERRWGWDCHGLPAENFVEKQLGITDRRDIGTKISLEEYITKARESMVANSETWEGTVDRIGRWVDFKGAYKTMDKSFMESVWWAFKNLYEAGKIYEGEKVLMYDTKFATPVSKAEVTMDNDAYQTVTDPSVYVKFKVKDWIASPVARNDNAPVYLLAWTTTPWTLPANTALAVNPKLDYAEVKVGDEIFILAKDLLTKVFVDEKKQPIPYEVLHEFAGEKLVGIKCEPLFENRGSGAHQVYAADYVEAEAGTGIVHLAPIYGEIDFELAEKEGIPKVHVIDDNGIYTEGEWKGQEVWGANKLIAKTLHERGVVWKIEYIQHEYPFNPRSKQRIMYRAIPSWFFDIQGSKPLLLEQNENINWFPEHLKEGRFKKNIEAAPDWNLSRDRFWATAMPVWKGDRGSVKVVGSYDELYELSGVRLEDYHRPWVDDVEFEIDGERFKRIDKVIDCWFESGSMPFAQLHYPFENKEKFEKNYPADFIVEYIGQVRAWFYYVHVVNTALAESGGFGGAAKKNPRKNAYKNVITTGVVAGNDGRKMSKSLGNFTDPNVLMDEFSADSLRFLLLSSPLLSGEDFALQDKDVSDVARKLAMIWNVYDFFTMYAEVDNFDSRGVSLGEDFIDSLVSPLDIWIVSRVHELRDDITKNMDGYNLPDAMSPILPFVDDLSNWFVRRSRRRFWKSEDDGDKAEAYETLYYVLTFLAILVAPFTPFLAEELYKNMTGERSVHLLDWPTERTKNLDVLDKMARTREIIERGLALRMEREDGFGQIKVRQPLAQMTYGGEKLDEFYENIIAEEVNVKRVVQGEEILLDKALTEELKREGFMREVIRVVQAARKKAGLNVDDRIKLVVSEFPEEFRETIMAETLAVELAGEGTYGYDEIVKVDGKDIVISLEKA
jgi:isoleucyl-tRNA synthetase